MLLCLPSADVSGVDWMVRHGRSLTLAIAVKSAPERLCGKDYYETVTETVLVNATADRIPIATSGIRAVGYLMRHQLRTEGGSSVSQRIITQLVKNQSSDIRLVSERVLWWVFKDPATPSMEDSLIKPLLKSLLDNTKDKNTTVRAQSEHTIVNLLRLRQGEETMQVGLPVCCWYSHMNEISAIKPKSQINLNPFLYFCSPEYYCHSGLGK
ncbi:hypothetical protein XENOCAPTIV_022891 [Xenoophorus captivus]|uniref:Uncharacterized protein n=1 Tax=Xenoophorus captivus TaxID=1517983 RepID=A0ABV0SIS3_9TELE